MEKKFSIMNPTHEKRDLMLFYLEESRENMRFSVDE